jgi:centractin
MEGTCVVADFGSANVYGGFGGAEQPMLFRNVVGDLKHRASLPTVLSEKVVSNDVDNFRGLLKLGYPLQHGHVVDWNGVSRVLSNMNGALGVNCKDHPVLMTEAALTSRPQRYKLAQLLFEECQHPAALFATQGLLSLYASGTTTGVVVDIGDGVTQTCPTFEGYTIRDAVRRVDFGGRDVTDYLRALLRQYGNFFDTSAEVDIVRLMKEQRCQVAASSKEVSTKLIKHKLPDGSEISLGPELSQATEVFFNPALIGREHGGVAAIAAESIRLTDVDLRREIFQNVVLAGGSTLTTNFPSRFLQELTKTTPKDCKVRIVAPAERLHTSWIGGSFLSQLSTFKQMLVKKSEYQEEGESVVHARLFC